MFYKRLWASVGKLNGSWYHICIHTSRLPKSRSDNVIRTLCRDRLWDYSLQQREWIQFECLIKLGGPNVFPRLSTNLFGACSCDTSASSTTFSSSATGSIIGKTRPTAVVSIAKKCPLAADRSALSIYPLHQGHDGRPDHQAGGLRPTRSNGPYETWSHKEEEAELIMCDGEMKIHP